ncbi:class I SAM-dependent RNA methyltransferase, partial [bacterium]|nr:class I SAM-dependent RNA methyltransferase [bacterium]
MGRENRLSAVAVLPQGLEAAGCEELSKLGAHDVQPLRRAAEFQAD